MSDSREPNSDLGEDRDFLNDRRVVDPAPLVSGGNIPEGYEGPYEPSVEEFVEGALLAAEARARMLFQGREEQR
jgi:hypothetical protein